VLDGWDLQHGSPRRGGSVPPCSPGSASCVRGHFVRYIAPQDALTGTSTDFGVTKVFLSN
jgi:hypothetical protein